MGIGFAECRGNARRVFGLIWLLAGASWLAGCSTGDKQTELENVAKDWSMVIRASQVIPVYPLTEDVQPGDVFLVTQTVQAQHEQYNHKGFLPLDVHVARLQPDGYEAFYSKSFVVGGTSKSVPAYWLKAEQTKDKAWIDAPQAGFPTYQFSVKRGGGFNAALPISGVPVGLTLLGADAADGTITIDKARTYGVDTLSLYQQLVAWAATPEAREFLSNHSSRAGKPQFLRVISRVYLTGRMIVQLNSATTSSLGVSAGAPKPVDLLTAAPGADTKAATAEQYGGNVAQLNDLLTKSLQSTKVNGTDVLLPGATLKVVAASSRSITMAEDFIDRPLVIGYLGFDVLIDERGRLGLATRTTEVLGSATIPGAAEFSAIESEFVSLRKQIQDRADRDAIAARLAEYVGGPVRAEAERIAASGATVTWDDVSGSLAAYVQPEMSEKDGPRLRSAVAAMRRVLSQ
ncbi:MAG: hypothetical protein AB7G11_02060 [Phycisphaerales bacterium]